MGATVRLQLDEAETLIKTALIAEGISNDAANSVAKALVAAEAEGQVGHGFSRLEDYIAQVRTGKINANAEISLQHPNPTAVAVNADFGFAFPALDRAIAAGVEVADTVGSSTMSVFNSHHCGALSLQVEKIADAGLIGMMLANTPKAIAPWGAQTPLFGTNPIAFAAPRVEGAPLVIDMSLSKVARGKIMHARKTGQTIPEGWALDGDGNPTTAPEAALAGSMLPIGDAKGSALALVVEILASVFTGGTMSHDASSFLSPDGPPPGVGQFLMAIKPPETGPNFLERLEYLLDAITALEGARLPGTRRLQSLQNAKLNGIEVPEKYVDTAKNFAAG